MCSPPRTLYLALPCLKDVKEDSPIWLQEDMPRIMELWRKDVILILARMDPAQLNIALNTTALATTMLEDTMVDALRML